jgi:RNA polymerase sigma factor for flagellar operon FliA
MASSSTLAYIQDGDAGNSRREQLIMEHLPQVRWIATRIHEKLPNHTQLDDLISVGIIGLINAIDSFDPSYNAQLKTFAEHRIRGAILDSIRGLDGIAPHKRRRAKDVQASIARLEQVLQRPPTEEEIAAELKMSLEEYRESLLELRGISIGSLDAPVGNGTRTLISYVADREENSPAMLLERSEFEKLLEEGINHMPRTERIVLDLYYRHGHNLREIAEVLDLHITRISQLKAQAVLRLRQYIERRWPNAKGVY